MFIFGGLILSVIAISMAAMANSQINQLTKRVAALEKKIRTLLPPPPAA
jgi:hypothetical protein